MEHSRLGTLRFAAAVCVVCATVVSSSAVLLAPRQRANAELDVRRNVLEAAGLRGPGERLQLDEVDRRFEAIQTTVVELQSGGTLTPADADAHADFHGAATDADTRDAPPNAAQVRQLPRYTRVYSVHEDDGSLRMVVLPVEGQGLWSTLRGFVALDSDLVTIRALTFYSHAETPGLGGEVDNPRWKARWNGRRAFDDDGAVAIEVARGRAGPPETDPYRVDGLSGATITSRGVTDLLRFWLGEHGFGPYLTRLKVEAG